MAIDPGGGGGRAGAATDDNYTLDKPYDVSGEPTADKMQSIDEMLASLYSRFTRLKQEGIDVLTAAVAILNSGSSGSIADGTGPWLTASITLTEAQLETLNTIPVTFVAAPGANLVIVPIMMTANWEITSVYTNNPTFGTTFGGAGAAPTSSQSMNSTATGKRLMWVHSPTVVLYTPAGTYPANTDLKLTSSANLTGTGTISAAGATFTIVYQLVSIL